jgi:hypothetical protein
MTEDTLANDLLRGIQEIAEFIDESEQRTASLCAQQVIPAGRLGYQWVASKRRLREHYDALTSGGAASYQSRVAPPPESERAA